MAITKPPVNDRTFQQSSWRLDDLFSGPESDKLKTAFDVLDKSVSEFEAFRSLLTVDIEASVLIKLISELESIYNLAYRVYGFAGLWFTEDTQRQEAQNLQAQVQQYMAGLTNRTLFFSLWWKDLDDANAERLMAGAGDYNYWLEEMRHFKPHTLSESEEKIVNLKNVTGNDALVTLFDAITNRYAFRIEIDGEWKEMTRGELMVLVRSTDPDLRARAYQELYRVYTEDSAILGQMYQTLVRDWRNENLTLRHYSSPLSVRNLANDIPDDVVDTLLYVAQANTDVFQRFFRLKARWLGVKKLRRYDVYAPVVESDKTYDFDDAANMVFAAFHEFEPKIAELARQVFEEDHVDSEVRKGKRGGAFCWSVVPQLTPWVAINYQGRANDVSTTAHELGHAIHGMLASDHSLFTFRSSLPLAETASTFGEMLLVDRLLAQEEDEMVRVDILFQQVDDAYATIMRQVFFALFEQQAHDLVHEGATVDDLATAYMANLQAQFGDSLEISDEFRWEWVAIPHIFHTPFYVYAYAFGQLLVFALYKQYKEEGASFVPRYLELLAAGGSQSPVDILSKAGIDIHSRAFWQGGFNIIAELVGQLEAIPVP